MSVSMCLAIPGLLLESLGPNQDEGQDSESLSPAWQADATNTRGQRCGVLGRVGRHWLGGGGWGWRSPTVVTHLQL